MYGTNPIRKPVQGDGATLDVQQIFATLQGEGPYAGWPAVFIRLGGCNLACDFCDTEFESFQTMTLEAVLASAASLAGETRRLIVITGGEPLRQPIAPLCNALLAAGFKVQIESNGTLYRDLPEGVEIVCSPKVTAGTYHKLRPDVLARVSALKFLISATRPEYAQIGDVGQDKTLPVYVQPMDEQNEAANEANLKLAVTLARQNGYRLSLQMHKITGIE